MKRDVQKTVLVALVKSPTDLELALEKHWYRVPVKSAPPTLRDFTTRYLAFYQNRNFKEESFQIRWYAEIVDTKLVKRKQLFPKEKRHPRANEMYLRLGLSEAKVLPQPIISKRKRPIVFIPTTVHKLLNASELNDLYDESALEDKLWAAMKHQNISAERQYFVGKSPSRFALDFAVFCQKHNLDIECDGDIYHSDLSKMRKDRKRNNTLTSLGWQVLRFGQEEIINKQYETLNIIKKTINEAGGAESADAPGKYMLFPIKTQPSEGDLFEKHS